MVFPPVRLKLRKAPAASVSFPRPDQGIAFNRHGASMSHITRKRIATQTAPAGVVPYLKVLTLASALLVVWAELCAM